MESTSGYDVVAEGLMILIGLAIPILIVMIWFRNRARKKAYALSEESFEPAQGSESDLRRAEAAVRGTPEEIRENLLRDHDLVDRFPTLQGFSAEYMDQLVAELRAKGIGCETYFQETIPMGVAMSMVESVGIHELYVIRERAEEARKLIASRITSKG